MHSLQSKISNILGGYVICITVYLFHNILQQNMTTLFTLLFKKNTCHRVKLLIIFTFRTPYVPDTGIFSNNRYSFFMPRSYRPLDHLQLLDKREITVYPVLSYFDPRQSGLIIFLVVQCGPKYRSLWSRNLSRCRFKKTYVSHNILLIIIIIY